MIDYYGLRRLLFRALVLYLATSFVQLEAKQGVWLNGGRTSADVLSGVRRYVLKIGRTEENDLYLFAPGN